MTGSRSSACFSGIGKMCSCLPKSSRRRQSNRGAANQLVLRVPVPKGGSKAERDARLEDESSESTKSTEHEPMFDATDREREMVREMETRLESDLELRASIERHRAGEPYQEVLLRFFRARKTVDAAITMLQKCMARRNEQNVDVLATQTLQQILKGNDTLTDAAAAAREDALKKQVPHGLLGYDCQGRVVCYRHFGGVKLWEVRAEGLNPEALGRHHQWLSERCLQAMGHRGRWIQIIDIKGCSLSQCWAKEHLSFVQLLTTCDSLEYPERLGQVYVINAPSYFASVFKFISKWLEPRTRQNIRILAGPEQYEEELAQIIDLKILPRHLGGDSELFADTLPRRRGSHTITNLGSRSTLTRDSKTGFGSPLQKQAGDKSFVMYYFMFFAALAMAYVNYYHLATGFSFW